jgi:V-type H+-transporting ATPase subunit D
LDWDRLKKVQGKKKRDTAARDAAQQALGELASQEDHDERGAEGGGNLLSSKDEDVIF